MSALMPNSGWTPSRPQQRGFTMVELLVALVISMLIALAAISALTVTRQGFTTVDTSSQLRDNGRFTADLIQRLALQSGFKDVQYAATPAAVAQFPSSYASSTLAQIGGSITPNVFGFNNSLSDGTDPLNTTTTRTAGSLGYGSDVLVLRYQEAETFPGSGVSDRSMIDCAGNSSTNYASTRDERMGSVLHVAESPANSGELALMCSTVSTGGTVTAGQPIVQGVENFQVLYGTDGVTPNAAPTVTPDSVPDRYLRADQMTVTGDAVATNNNWRRVRSLRIGLVLRGPVNSAQEKLVQTLYPEGAVMSSTDDPGTIFSAPADGRLRQVLTFTVHLRNDQAL